MSELAKDYPVGMAVAQGGAISFVPTTIVKNTSGLRPLGRAVLVESYEPEVRAGVIFIPPNVTVKTMMVEQRATVIEVGPEAWKEERVPRARPGDRVLVSKYAGYIAQGTADGKLYRLVNANDIFAGITEEGG